MTGSMRSSPVRRSSCLHEPSDPAGRAGGTKLSTTSSQPDDNVRLSFILATCGRTSIDRMLRSMEAQYALRPTDELLIVGSTETERRVQCNMRFITSPMGNDWGHTERNIGMGLATGTHLVFIDDDDTMTVGSITVIRNAVARSPDNPIMFRMVDPNGLVIWQNKQVRMGNHGTPQFVVPNKPNRLGTWGHRYEGDFDFVKSTLALYPNGEGDLVWNPRIIYACRNQG